MRYVGQRYNFSDYVRYFPKLEDSGKCTTLREGLEFIGCENGVAEEEMLSFVETVVQINLEFKEYCSGEIRDQRMLSLMREGKLRRPVSWDDRRLKYHDN